MYSSGDIARYDDPYLYKRINTWIKGENYYVVNLEKSKILKDVQSMYPMILALDLNYISSNTVAVKLTFTPVDMIIRNQNVGFALIGSTVLRIYS